MRESKTLSEWYEDWRRSHGGETWYGSDYYYFNAKPFSKARMVHFFCLCPPYDDDDFIDYERLDLVPDDEANEGLEEGEEEFYYLEE